MVWDASAAKVDCEGSVSVEADTRGLSTAEAMGSALGEIYTRTEAAAKTGNWVTASVEAGNGTGN